MSKKKTIVQGNKANFETLRRAFSENAVCLMDCIEKSTGEHVAVICAVESREEFTFIPFAKFFNGNPYEMLTPPMEYEEKV